MCGIFGIVVNNNENIYQLVINGLRQLQNRGYDSAGVSLVKDETFEICKYASTNEEDALQKLQNIQPTEGNNINPLIYSGMGHNRWATHGIKNDINAHPHLSNKKMFSIVHNGIIENYTELKESLIKKGYTFYSQTDTEVIVNLLEYNYNNMKNNNTNKNKLNTCVFHSIQKTILQLRGTYGLLIQSFLRRPSSHPQRQSSGNSSCQQTSWLAELNQT